MADIRAAFKISVDGEGKLIKVEETFGKVEQAAKKAESATKSFAQSIVQGIGQGVGQRVFDSMASSLGSLERAFAANFSRVAEYSKSVSQLSTLTGLSAERVQVWESALKRAGKGVEVLAVGSNLLKKNLYEATDATKQSLAALGLSMTELRKASPDKQLEMVSRAMASVEDPSKRAALAMRLFGESGTAIAQVSPMIDAVEAKLDKFALKLTNEQVAAVRDLSAAWSALDKPMEGFWNQVIAGIASSESLHVLLGGIAEALAEMSKWAKENQESIRGLADTLTTTLGGALVAVAGVGEVAIGGLTLAFGTLYLTGKQNLEMLGAMARANSTAMSGSPIQAAKGLASDIAGINDAAGKGFKALDEKLKAISGAGQRARDVMSSLSDSVSGASGKRHVGAGTSGSGGGSGAGAPGAGGKMEKDSLWSVRERILYGQLVENATGPGYVAGSWMTPNASGQQAQGDKAWLDAQQSPEYRAMMAKQLEKTEAFRKVKGGAPSGVNWTQSMDTLAQMLSATGQTGGKLGSILGGASGIGASLQQGGGMKGILGGLGGGKGLQGFLGSLGTIGSLAGSAFGIGKGIVGLFKKKPSYEKQMQDKYRDVSAEDMFSQMAGKTEYASKDFHKLMESAKGTAAYTEWMAKNLDLSAGGVSKMVDAMQYLGKDGAVAVAGTFSSSFWATMKQRGLAAATETFAPIFDKVSAQLTEMGLDPTSLGMDRVKRLMDIGRDPKTGALLGAVQGNADFLKGQLNAGYLTGSDLTNSGKVASATFSELRKQGLTDKESYEQMADYLSAVQRASEASGQKIPEEIQNMIAAAKQNGIEFVKQPIDAMAGYTKEIRDFLVGKGYGGGSSGGSSAGEMATPASGGGGSSTGGVARSDWGPRPNGYPSDRPWPPTGYEEGGYVAPKPGGTLVRVAEAGQGEYMVPASKMGGGSTSIGIAALTVNIRSLDELGPAFVASFKRATESSPVLRDAIQRSVRQ